MHQLHQVYRQFYDKIFFVIMKRPIEDIIASQERIEWGEENEQFEKNSYNSMSVFDMFYGDFMPISKIKYRVWDMFQSNIVDNKQWAYCKYDWLKSHEMYIPKEKRENFKTKQTNLLPKKKKNKYD